MTVQAPADCTVQDVHEAAHTALSTLMWPWPIRQLMKEGGARELMQLVLVVDGQFMQQTADWARMLESVLSSFCTRSNARVIYLHCQCPECAAVVQDVML